jgi:hypothetical protein
VVACLEAYPQFGSIIQEDPDTPFGFSVLPQTPGKVCCEVKEIFWEPNAFADNLIRPHAENHKEVRDPNNADLLYQLLYLVDPAFKHAFETKAPLMRIIVTHGAGWHSFSLALSHAVADAATHYELLNVLNDAMSGKPTMPVPLKARAHQDVIKDNIDDMFAVVGFSLGQMGPVHHVLNVVIPPDKLAAWKADAIKKSGEVSTHDAALASIAGSSGANLGTLTFLMNNRGMYGIPEKIIGNSYNWHTLEAESVTAAAVRSALKKCSEEGPHALQMSAEQRAKVASIEGIYMNSWWNVGRVVPHMNGKPYEHLGALPSGLANFAQMCEVHTKNGKSLGITFECATAEYMGRLETFFKSVGLPFTIDHNFDYPGTKKAVFV